MNNASFYVLSIQYKLYLYVFWLSVCVFKNGQLKDLYGLIIIASRYELIRPSCCEAEVQTTTPP